MNLTVVTLFSLIELLFLSAAFSENRPALVDLVGYADILLVNGKIAAMDDRSSAPNTPGHVFEAMAVKGKRIMALGTNDAMRMLAGAKTEVVDVGGKTVVPGLIQTHYHPEQGAAAIYGPKLGLVDPSIKLTVVAEKNAEATARRIRDTIVNAIQVRKLPKGQWITVGLQDGKEIPRATTHSWIFQGKINRRQLDKGTEGYPVLVKTGSQAVLNGAAVEQLKRDFPDWEESTDLENRIGAGKDGQGAVPEIESMPWELWWKDKPVELVAEALRLQGLDSQKLGITTISERIAQPKVIAGYQLLNREGKMPHRVAYYIESQRGNYFGLKSTREFYRASGASWTNHASGGEMLWLAGMSNEIWDSIYNEVCLGPDVATSAEIKARERCPGPGSKPWESIKAGILNGWRPVSVHGTSSHGARLYIQMLEEAMKEGHYSLEYMKSLRTTLEHCILLGSVPDVMAGLRKFGIIVNVTPIMLEDVPENIKDYGDQLKPFVMPVRTWISQGIRVTLEAFNSDFWTPMHTLITRKIHRTPGGFFPGVPPPTDLTPVVILPDEAIDRVTAMKMVTTWASEYMLAEDTIGTLEPGKYADFAVLDKDFFTIPVDDIRTVKVIMTGLNGRIVYDQRRAGDSKQLSVLQ